MVSRPEEVGIYGRFAEHVKDGVPGGGGGVGYARPNLIDNPLFHFMQRSPDIIGMGAMDTTETWRATIFDRWQIQYPGGGIPLLACSGHSGIGNYQQRYGIEGIDPMDPLTMRQAIYSDSSPASGTGSLKLRQVHRNVLNTAGGGPMCLSFMAGNRAGGAIANADVYFVRKLYPNTTNITRHLIGSFALPASGGLAGLWQLFTMNFTLPSIHSLDPFYFSYDTTGISWANGTWAPDSTYWALEFDFGQNTNWMLSHVKLEKGTGRTPCVYDSPELAADWERCTDYYQQSGGHVAIPQYTQSPMYYRPAGWQPTRFTFAQDWPNGHYCEFNCQFHKSFPWDWYNHSGLGWPPGTYPWDYDDYYSYTYSPVYARFYSTVSLKINHLREMTDHVDVRCFEHRTHADRIATLTVSSEAPPDNDMIKKGRTYGFYWIADAEIYTEGKTMP